MTGPAGRFDTGAATGLAGVILDHAAMAMADEPNAAALAMASLSETTGMALDVAAGVLLGATVLIAAGGLEPDHVAALADTYVKMADDDQPDDYDLDLHDGTYTLIADDDDQADDDDGYTDDERGELSPPLAPMPEPDFSMFPESVRAVTDTDRQEQ